jgi:8-hydroxy-5-deazaflavin:NADPH oxidoreductase
VIIAILGAGNMGQALCKALAGFGHDIRLSYTRDAAKLPAIAQAVGAVATTPQDAIAGAHVVFLSVPPDSLGTIIDQAGDFTGKTVVSVSSGLDLDPTGARIGIPTVRVQSVAEDLAELLPSAHVVQAFTLTFADMLANRGDGQRPTLPIAGDDPTAVAMIAELIEQAGFEPLSIGGLQQARGLETLATATAQFAVTSGLAPMLAVKLVRNQI